jgi:hypothetical protein
MAVKTRPTTILLKRASGAITHEEGRAASTITPGMLVVQNSSGSLIPHNVANGRVSAQFALEDALQGKTIADNYASGDLVFTAIGRSGDVFFAWLKAGQSCNPGTMLASNGDGTLRAVSAGTDFEVCEALETIGVTGADARVRVRVK